MPTVDIPPPPNKPTLKKDGFRIKDGVITCEGHERVDGSNLERLFHPERLPPNRTRARTVNEAKKLFSRAFFAAQLRYYGILFPKTATEAQLRSLLDKAVLARQCTRVPPSVERVLSELKLEYSKKVEDWHKVVDTWDEDWTRQREEAWAQLETPAERAAHDLDRFMEHYFLTDGQPDPAKKPEPLALYGLVDSQVIANLCQRTALVPGLNIVQAGSADDPTICIGWEHASLHGLILEIANSSLEKQKRKAQKMWNKAMETHRQLVETNSKSAPEVQHGESKEQLALSMACGSFVVRCKAIADLCADKPLSTNLSINITDTIANNNEILRAAVDFGIFRGTAVLSCSQDVLNWFVRFYEKTAKPSTTTTKDGLESSSSPAAKKRRLDNAAEGEHPVKQQKHDGPLPRGRIILQMRGLDTTNYKMCEDIQHGHLDFIDSSWSKFTGMVQVPGVLQPVEFEGFRVANKADVEPPPWKSFFPGAATPGTIGDVVPETSR